MSGKEYLEKLLKAVADGGISTPPGSIKDIQVKHDSWCGMLHGESICTCNPEIWFEGKLVEEAKKESPPLKSFVSKNIPASMVTNFSASILSMLQASLKGQGKDNWESIFPPFAFFDRCNVKRKVKIQDFDNFIRPGYNHVYVDLTPERLISCIKKAEKFMLPDEGETIDDREMCLKVCDEMEGELLLPFQHVCLEFFGADGDIKAVFYCEQVYDSHDNKPYIFVLPFFAEKMTPNLSKYWGWSACAYCVLFSGREKDGMFTCGSRFAEYGGGFTKETYSSGIGAIQNVLSDFLTCVSCQGFSCETFVPSKTQIKKKFNEKRLPFFEYHVLGIGINHLSFRKSGNSTGLGSGRKQRYHSVRGHIRHYKSGKMVWVRPHFSGNPALGIVKKDYTLK